MKSSTIDGRIEKRIFLSLVLIHLILVVLDYVFNYSLWFPSKPFRRIFNLARDNSLGGWVASVQSLWVGLMALIIARGESESKHQRGHRAGWGFIGAFFIYMSVDDACKIHERLGSAATGWGPLQSLFDSFPSYAWQLLLGPLFAGAGVFIFVFLWKQFEWQRRKILILALGLFALAMGVDFFEGVKDGYYELSKNTGLSASVASHYSRVLEEWMELMANTCFLLLFIRTLRVSGRKIQLHFAA